MTVSPAKTAEPIEMLWAQGTPHFKGAIFRAKRGPARGMPGLVGRSIS